MHRRLAARAVLPTALFAATVFAQDAPLDLVLRGGQVIDGTGAAATRADLGIRDGRVVALGAIAADAPAKRSVDATGLTIAPGFIDVHAHADDDAARLPDAENFVRMGVTTIISGNCGGSVPVLTPHFERLTRDGISVNYGSLIGHGTIRTGVMRTVPRAPNPEELEKMKQRVDAAMREGAFGMSTGLIYVPGTYAATEELIELSKVVAAHGGVYASHMRDEAKGVLDSIEEALRIGREAGCHVHLSHLKASGKSVWGWGEQIVAKIAAARAAGARVTGDQYVYTASSTSLDVLFPSKELSVGRAAFGKRLGEDAEFARAMADAVLRNAREAGFDDLAYCQIASAPGHKEWNGKRIPDVARALLARDDAGAQAEAACRMFVDASEKRVSMIYHKMAEDDVERILRAPFVSIASDAGIRSRDGDDRPHPRGSGNNARVLGRYVRERGVIPLELAVQKMTSLPAAVFGLAERGKIAVGLPADLVLFDAAKVNDTATYEESRGDPVGIPYVLVNGVLVVEEGKHTGARPGHVLRHRSSAAK